MGRIIGRLPSCRPAGRRRGAFGGAQPGHGVRGPVRLARLGRFSLRCQFSLRCHFSLDSAQAEIEVGGIERRWAAARLEQVQGSSEIFPRFGGISTHPGHAERFTELAELIESFATNPERPFTVMRSFPAIHFLTGRRSPTRIDWYLALEVRGFRREHLADLLALDGIVFFQREAYVGRTPLARRDDTPCQSADFADSPGFVQTVYEAGRLVASTRGFCVVDMAR